MRGSGLLAGVQLSSGELAARVADELREEGILVGLTGKLDDVLKIRPPLVFGEEHAELLIGALDRVLA
jgi:4-aminobutyrate aminotransferase-like enzyme